MKHQQEHDQLRVMIDSYLTLFDADVPDIADIMKRRLAFSNAYLSHVAHEGQMLHEMRTGDPMHPVDRAVSEHSCRLREIMPGYSALVSDWTPPRIVAEWPAYCREVRTQVKRYYAFLAWEEAELLPLLDQPRRAEAG